MKLKKLIGVVAASLILLVAVYPMPHANAFTNNQYAAISIGELKSPQYGVLNSEGGLTYDPSGSLWVADSFNNRVLGFTAPFYDNMTAAFVIGQPGFQETEPASGGNRLNHPLGVASDPKGNLWVADALNSRVLEFKPPFTNGMNSSVVIGQSGFSGGSPNLSRNGLDGPWGITFDTSGNLWVADSGNSRVLEYQPPFSTGMNASLILGEPDFTHNSCNPYIQLKTGCGNSRILNVPEQIAFDPSGDFWFSEGPTGGGRILEFKPPFANEMNASFATGPLFLSAIVFDAAGNLWLGRTGNGVFEYKAPFTEHSIVWGNGAFSNWNLTLGTYPGERADLPLSPSGFDFDSAGNLWVIDFRSNYMMNNLYDRVLGFDAQAHSVNTLNGVAYFQNEVGILVPLSSIPVSQVGSITFPYGLFNFTIQGLPRGGSVTLKISFPHPLPVGAGWWSKVGDRWSQLPTNETYINGNNVTLALKNASPNGAIAEMGGPGLLAPTVTSTTSPQGATSRNIGTNVSGFSIEVIVIGLIIGVLIVAFERKRRETLHR